MGRPSRTADSRPASPGSCSDIADALARGQAAGVDTSALHAIDVRIADLGGLTPGQAAGPSFWQDDKAAAWGWFLAPTPRDDGEFPTPGKQGERHHLNLLTGLAHEVGHLLGQGYEADGLMAQTLTPATRTDPPPDPNPVDVAAPDRAFADGKVNGHGTLRPDPVLNRISLRMSRFEPPAQRQG